MGWIKLHDSVFRHGKTRRAASLLGVKRQVLVGYMAALWSWAVDAVDERGGPISEDDVALATDWDGDISVFCSALKEVRFLDKRGRGGSGLYIHNWPIYYKKLHEKRVAEREKKREQRARQRGEKPESNLAVPRDKQGDNPPREEREERESSSKGIDRRSVGRSDQDQQSVRSYSNNVGAAATPRPAPTDQSASPSATDRPTDALAPLAARSGNGLGFLPDGEYGCLLSACDCSGKMTERHMQLLAENGSGSGLQQDTISSLAKLLGYPITGPRVAKLIRRYPAASDETWREVVHRAVTLTGKAAPERNPKDDSVKEGWVRAAVESLL